VTGCPNDHTGKERVYRIAHLNQDLITEGDDLVAVETTLTVLLNGEELVSLLCSPGGERYLALGFLRCEGYISTLEDVRSIESDPARGRITITTTQDRSRKKQVPIRTSSGSCLKGSIRLPAGRQEPKGAFKPDALLGLMETFSTSSALFARTGCVHSAALSDGLSLLLFADDIGRHNAFDRVAGEALAKGLDCRGKILFTSGRISSEVVRKAALLELTAIVSPSAITSLAIELAYARGITLLGFARGGRGNIYGTMSQEAR